jgi:hypothetical protein
MSLKYIWVANRSVGDIGLSYYLCAVPSENGIVYGLRVDKSTPGGVLVERGETPPVLDDIGCAMQMADVFAQGTVMPCALLETVDDYLSA